MSPRSFALALVGIAGLVAATPAAPVPKAKPTKLAILYARTEDVADWLLVDADGTNPRPFLWPDGKREPIAVLPGQRPVVVSRVPEDTLTLLHPNGGDIVIALNASPMLEVWRAWRWEYAWRSVRLALEPESGDAAIEHAVEQVIWALGAVDPAELPEFGSSMSLIGISPDGTRVAFAADYGGPASILDIPAKKVIDLDRVVRKPKGSSTFGHHFSPDWNWVEYSACPDNTVEFKSAVYIARIDGSAQTRVTDNAMYGGKRMHTIQQWRGRDLAIELNARSSIVSPDNTLAILAPEQDDDPSIRFFLHNLRTKRETALPKGFGRRDCDDFRWVRVPADRD